MRDSTSKQETQNTSYINEEVHHKHLSRGRPLNQNIWKKTNEKKEDIKHIEKFVDFIFIILSTK